MNRILPEFRFADETEVSAAQLMTPEWANFSGNVHGGSVLRLVDDIAYVCAMRYAATVCVTAAVDRVEQIVGVSKQAQVGVPWSR